jgi:hypothetical protein
MSQADEMPQWLLSPKQKDAEIRERVRAELVRQGAFSEEPDPASFIALSDLGRPLSE